MKAMMWPIALVVIVFTCAVCGMACLRSCESKPNAFVMDRGDYRYVKLEEEQFDQLIKALENIAAQKGTNETSNR